jgi:hypothetical protein
MCTGYVAVAWSVEPGEMYPADAIVGFSSDKDLRAYYLKVRAGLLLLAGSPVLLVTLYLWCWHTGAFRFLVTL